MLKIIWFLVVWMKSIWKDNGESLLLGVLAFIIGMLVGWLLVPGYLQKDYSNQIMPNQTIVKNKLYCPDIPDISIPENLKTIDFSTKENMKSFITALIFREQDMKRQMKSQMIRNISVVFEEMKIQQLLALQKWYSLYSHFPKLPYLIFINFLYLQKKTTSAQG